MQRTDESRFGMPYLGPESFQPEDADLFFGREREAEQLIAMILSARCALLHARSGAGKTSLLNAVVIPRLESRGHLPVRILPGDDPIEAVRVTTLQTLLPPPRAEAQALERARVGLGLAPTDTLGELLGRYDGLAEGGNQVLRSTQETRRRLVAPIEVETSRAELVLPVSGLVMPWLCRVLRSSVEVVTFAAHLAAISPGTLDETTRLSDLAERLADPRLTTDYAQLLEALYLPIPDLRPFFENLFAVYGRRFEAASRWRRFVPILVLDQFEELFTRFVDPGQTAEKNLAGQPDWRLRWQFFEELEKLYADPTVEPTAEPEIARTAPLPLRCVVSIRNEYLAQLDPIRRFVPELARSTFHLELLGTTDAEAAIRKPAERYGVCYGEGCAERIVEQLALEERYVDPPYVQIVCSRLWKNRADALTLGAAESTAENEIKVEDFQALGEMQGILDRFFADFLATLASEEERFETLEMLERLITAAGTRNIVSKDELETARFRRPELRHELLGRLQNGNVVRIERRVGTSFVEITHEFLIAPIRRTIREEVARNADYRDFVLALESLSRVRQSPELREQRHKLLDAVTIERLEKHENRLRWGYLGTETMLRSAILAGCDPPTLSLWGERFSTSEEPWTAQRLLEEAGGRHQRILSLDELRAVQKAVAAGLVEPGRLEPQQVELVLRSLLVQATDVDREQVIFWTREAMRRGT